MATIDTLDIQITSDSSLLVSELTAISKALRSIGTANKNLTKLKTNLNDVSKTSTGIDKTTKSLGKLSKIINKIKFVGLLVGLDRLSGLIATSVNSINDYVEDINLFRQTMGRFSKEAGDYAHRLQELMGIDANQFMRNLSIFMSMLRGFGVGEEQAYAMSKGLTELAYDFASLYNLDVEETFLKLQSAIAGEIEPIRRLGVSLTEATLKEIALAHGITKNVEAMTEAEKAQLRYIAIVDTAVRNNVIGDFARTLQSPANAMRILKQQITQLSRAIGSVFLPIIAQVIPYVLAFTKVLTNAVRSLAILVGFEMPDWSNSDWGSSMSASASDTEQALGGASEKAKELKKHLMGFDELNVLPSQDTSSGSGGASAGGGGDLGLDLESVWDEALLSGINSQTDEIIAKFKELGQSIKSAFVDNLDTIKAVVGLILGIGAGVGAWKLISSLAMGFGSGFGIIKSAFETVYIYFLMLKDSIIAFFTGASSTFLPFVAVVMIVASVVYTLWKNFDLVLAIAKDFIEKIKLKEKFESIKTALEPLLEKVAGLGDLFEFVGTIVLTILQPSIGIAMGLFNALITTIKPLIDIVSGVIDMFAGLGTFLKGVFTGDLNLVKKGISTFSQGVKETFSGLVGAVITLIGGFVQGFVAYFDSLFTRVKVIMLNIKNNVGNSIATMVTATLSAVSGWISNIGTSLTTLKTNVINKIKELWNGVKSFYNSSIKRVFTVSFWLDAFLPMNSGFSSVIKGMLNAGIDMINRFIRWLNSKLKFSWNGLSIAGKKIYDGGSVQLVRISEITQRFQDGGFIEDGLFTMNKGEIAGQFDNGKSVVANNYQITEGIAKAVYEAIARANGLGGANTTVNAYLELDGDVVAKKVFKVHNGIVNQTGNSPLTI